MPATQQKAVAGCFRVHKEQEKAAEDLARRAKEADERWKKDAEAGAEPAESMLEAGSSFVDVMGTLKLNERRMLDHANLRSFPISYRFWESSPCFLRVSHR